MSKGPWVRDPCTGIAISRLVHSFIVNIRNPEAELRVRYPDCNLFNLTSMAAIADKSLEYFRDVMLGSNRVQFAMHREYIVDARGKHVDTIYATHTDSLMCALEQWAQLIQDEPVKVRYAVNSAQCRS